MPKQWRTGSKEAPQRAQRALNSRVATADQALAVAADAGNKHALADAAGAGRRSRKRLVPKVAGQSTHQKNQAPKAKGALAAAAGEEANTKEYLKKCHWPGRSFGRAGVASVACSCEEQGANMALCGTDMQSFALLSHHRSPAFESQRL